MLNIVEARNIYNANPADPYVVLPGHDIEVRFSEDGMITAAYNAEVTPSIRWYSEEFKEYLDKERGGYNVLVERIVQVREAQKRLEGPRKAKRIRLDPNRDL